MKDYEKYKGIEKVLDYDKETGLFKWSKNSYSRVRGKQAGNKSVHGYIEIRYNKRLLKAHRIAWYITTGVTLPKLVQVDHINGVRDDNRFCNIRLVLESQNHINQTLKSNNTSGFKGVFYDKRP